MTSKRVVAKVIAIWLRCGSVVVVMWLLWDIYLLIGLFPGGVGPVLTTLV